MCVANLNPFISNKMEKTKIIALSHAIVVAYCKTVSNGVYKKLKSPMYVGENIQNTYTDWFKDICPAIKQIVPTLINEEPCIQIELEILESTLNSHDKDPILILSALKEAAQTICSIIINMVTTETKIKGVYSDIKQFYETKEKSTKSATQATTNG